MSKLRVLSLFAGIGGFDLGLERTGGFETVAFCEIDKKAQLVLKKHWPEVPIYEDVATLSAERLQADGIAVDVICGGFHCQDISTAGRGAGLAGERSGLWFDYARLIGELRPSHVIVENVSALLHRGLDAVLGSLAEIGYDAEWHCIPASYVGAPHRRDRIWVVAHSGNSGFRPDNGSGENPSATGQTQATRNERQRLRPVSGRSGEDLADAALVQRNGGNNNAGISLGGQSLPQPGNDGGPVTLADAECERQPGPGQSIFALCPKTGAYRQAVDAVASGIGQIWVTEPNVGRVADGVPGRVDRLKQLGNAVVPQIPELIGNAILASLAEQKEAA